MVWQDWTHASLLQDLRGLPPRTITILSSFNRDKRGQQFNSGDLIASVTRVASAPVYGIARNWVGDGIVGGVTMDFGDDGMRTGRMLLQVLDRASPKAAAASVGDRPSRAGRGLARAGALGAVRKPAPTRHGGSLPDADGLGPLQGIHPCRSRPADRAVRTDCGSAHSTGATAPRRSRAASEARTVSGRATSGSATSGRECSRRRRSSVRGSLVNCTTTSASKLALLSYGSRPVRRSPTPAKSSGSPQAMARTLEIARSVRDLSHSLHPARLRLIGLVADATRRFAWSCHTLGSPSRSRTTMFHRRLSADVMLCMFRVVQEALQNAIKYSLGQGSNGASRWDRDRAHLERRRRWCRIRR